MPQMSPLYWEVLSLTFILCLTMMSTIIYHHPKIYMNNNINMKTTFNQINWKW
uniref:ATP synthase F0 subunit 8 n=1 Tax=Diolcus variegatus TaxID=2080392 RepID=A0A2P1CLS0_9HEMI|nr:ATP synthase F0 subunit 8 [Diolcus variegatus]